MLVSALLASEVTEEYLDVFLDEPDASKDEASLSCADLCKENFSFSLG
jgi:hypothetical protein